MAKFKRSGSIILTTALLLSTTACQSNTTVGTSPTTTSQENQQGNTQETSKSSGEKIHLTFWDENADPTRSPILQGIVDSFNKEQDRIEVEYVGVPQSDVQNKYNVAIAAGETPDIGGLQENWLSGYIIRDAIIPLDSYFDAWDKKDDMVPSAIASVRDNAPDKKLYMLPTSVNTPTLWIRSDMLKENNLSIPNTWDEFFETVEKLTDKPQNKFGHTIRGGSGGGTAFFQILYSYSGEPVFDENGKSTINSPTNVEFTQKYFDLYGKYTPESDITAGWKEIAANFGTGVSATLLHNLGSYQNHVDAFEDSSMFEAMPLPVSVKGNRNMSSSSIGYMIFKNSKNPDAAWEFLSYMLNVKNNSIWNKTIGQLPTNIMVMEEPWVEEMQHISIMSQALTASDTTSMGIPIYLPDYATIASKTIEPAIQQVMSGQMTAQEMLDMWADALNDARADYEKNVLK